MPAEPNHEYRHTAERLQELEETVKKLQGELTAIPFYARKIADLEAQVKQLESDRDELFLAMERARIPRYPTGPSALYRQMQALADQAEGNTEEEAPDEQP